MYTNSKGVHKAKWIVNLYRTPILESNLKESSSQTTQLRYKREGVGNEIGGGLTCVNLALEVNLLLLLPLGVATLATCCEVYSGHVETQVAPTYTSDVADQVWVFLCHHLVPRHYCIVAML